VEIIPEATLEILAEYHSFHNATTMPSNNLPDFYSDILKYWRNTRSTFQKNTFPHNKIIWKNNNITIDGKATFYKIWLEKNIVQVEGVFRAEDLLNNNDNSLPLNPFTLFFRDKRRGIDLKIVKRWDSKGPATQPSSTSSRRFTLISTYKGCC